MTTRCRRARLRLIATNRRPRSARGIGAEADGHTHPAELGNDVITPPMLDADTTAKKLAMRQRIGATDPAAAYGGQVNYVEDTSAARTASDDATRSYGTHQHGLSLQDSLAWDNSDPKKLGVKDGGITAAKMASGVIPAVPSRAGAFTADDESKLDGIEAGAQVNRPADASLNRLQRAGQRYQRRRERRLLRTLRRLEPDPERQSR